MKKKHVGHTSSEVNKLNRIALAKHVKSMEHLKPKGGDPDYATKIAEWRKALTFSKNMMHAVNNMNNTAILAGKPNVSKLKK
jgi:hypothetical protein